MQAMEPVELPTDVNVLPDPATASWYLSQMMGIDEEPMTASPAHPEPSYSNPQPLPLRPGPRPLISQTRTHSYDSTASTVLDVPTQYDVENVQKPEFHTPPQISFIMELPSQQQSAKRRPPPLKRRKIEEEPTCCEDCEFYPSPTGQRRKLEKHYLTDGHRRKTGQVVPEKKEFPCPICGTGFNRWDNMSKHARVEHGLLLSGTRTRGRRKQGRKEGDWGRGMVDSVQAGGWST
jgi:uncharacterized C2H2 Zn-finger protein